MRAPMFCMVLNILAQYPLRLRLIAAKASYSPLAMFCTVLNILIQSPPPHVHSQAKHQCPPGSVMYIQVVSRPEHLMSARHTPRYRRLPTKGSGHSVDMWKGPQGWCMSSARVHDEEHMYCTSDEPTAATPGKGVPATTFHIIIRWCSAGKGVPATTFHISMPWFPIKIA